MEKGALFSAFSSTGSTWTPAWKLGRSIKRLATRSRVHRDRSTSMIEMISLMITKRRKTDCFLRVYEPHGTGSLVTTTRAPHVCRSQTQRERAKGWYDGRMSKQGSPPLSSREARRREGVTQREVSSRGTPRILGYRPSSNRQFSFSLKP